MSLEKDITNVKKLVEADNLFKAASTDDLANRPVPVRRPFWIDFDTWVIMGKDEAEATKRAIKYIESGAVPSISEVSEADDISDDSDVLSDFIRLKVDPNKPYGNNSYESLPVVEAQEGPMFKAASDEEVSNRPEPKITNIYHVYDRNDDSNSTDGWIYNFEEAKAYAKALVRDGWGGVRIEEMEDSEDAEDGDIIWFGGDDEDSDYTREQADADSKLGLPGVERR